MDKIKLSPVHAIFLIYAIALSIILKKILIVQFIALILFLLLDSKIREEIKGILFIVCALLPLPSVLGIFLFYLPFCVYGNIFKDESFAKKYLFGYAISLFAAALAYILAVISGKTNFFILASLYFIPVLVIASKLILKKESSRLFGAFKIANKEIIAILAVLGFLFYFGGFIVNSDNLYNSNGTYMYAKFHTLFDSITHSGKLPQYDERIGQGEQLFLSDTPTFYSNLAFVNSMLKLEPVLFFNSMTFFIIWLSAIGAFLFLSRLLSPQDSYKSLIISIIGAMAIVYSFIFFQFFESFKQSSTYPYNFLALALIFSFSWTSNEMLAIILSLVASFLTHPTKAAGVILIAGLSFLFILLSSNPKEKIAQSWKYIRENKFLIAVIIISLLLLPLYYIYPGVHFKNYARSGHFPLLSEINPVDYFKGFLLDKNTNPLSYNYPDARRLDQKKLGFFLSSLGVISLILILIAFKNHSYKKARFFVFAYIGHFLISSVMVYFPPFPQAEYGYRTAIPFLLVTLVVSMCAIVFSIRKTALYLMVALVFLGGFLHSSPYLKENMRNIHSEAVIGGKTFAGEINVIKQLPIDGRILTLGMYSNAIDMAFSVHTDRYFSRYGYLQWDFTDNIYDKLTTMNSFGAIEVIQPMTGAEFSNYLRLAGYKYAFLNICHPVGNAALQKLYPENAYAIYQNPNYNCNVILGINNSNYAEKISIVEHVNDSEYKSLDGYWHITFNRNRKMYDFNLEPYASDFDKKAMKPIPLQFKRPDFDNVEIYGDFEDGDWIVFKEEYFPRWSAQMDGKPIPLLATNNRMMIVKANEGNKIELHYSMLKEEKVATSISLPAILALLLILIVAI